MALSDNKQELAGKGYETHGADAFLDQLSDRESLKEIRY